MVSRYWGPFLLLMTCAVGVPSPLWADCSAVLRLATLYDAFFALTQEKGDAQKRVAARFYPTIATTDFSGFVSELKPGPLHDDLTSALDAGRDVARSVLTTTEVSAFLALDIADDIQIIATFLDASDCPRPEHVSADALKPVAAQTAAPLGFDDPTGTSAPQPHPASVSKLGGIVAGTILAICILIAIAMRSRKARIYRMRRLPRRSIKLNLSATFETEEHTEKTEDVVALDISLGGAKLRLAGPLPDGANIVLKLPTGPISGSVVWSTAHYVGIMFDEQLSDAELNQTLSTS